MSYVSVASCAAAGPFPGLVVRAGPHTPSHQFPSRITRRESVKRHGLPATRSPESTDNAKGAGQRHLSAWRTRLSRAWSHLGFYSMWQAKGSTLRLATGPLRLPAGGSIPRREGKILVSRLLMAFSLAVCGWRTPWTGGKAWGMFWWAVRAMIAGPRGANQKQNQPAAVASSWHGVIP